MTFYYEFLDELRASGAINMFGAPAVLREQFGMTKQEALDIFKGWTEDRFGEKV